MTTVVVGPDGLARCPWGVSPLEYAAYHDQEWGRKVRGERALFERFSLEGFQSGLSWLTILRKREAFRAAFAGFDPEAVAGFGADDEARLMGDAGIVRNGAKVRATVANARAVLALREHGGLEQMVLAHAPAPRDERPASTGDVPASTPESVALAKALKRAGMMFVGPTTVYSTMQACGLVDDHLRGCHVPAPDA